MLTVTTMSSSNLIIIRKFFEKEATYIFKELIDDFDV